MIFERLRRDPIPRHQLASKEKVVVASLNVNSRRVAIGRRIVWLPGLDSN